MITKKVLLFLPSAMIDKPIIYDLVKQYDIIVNIFRAKITVEEQGFLILELTGNETNIDDGMEYLRRLGIKVDDTNKGMIWNESSCCHCGACVPHCPTKALDIQDRDRMSIVFNSDYCIECLKCIEVCPYKACSSIFEPLNKQ